MIDELSHISRRLLAIDNESKNLDTEKERLRSRLFELLDETYHTGSVMIDIPETGMKIGRTEAVTKKAGWNTEALKMVLGPDYESVVDWIAVFNQNKLDAALLTGKIDRSLIEGCTSPEERGLRLYHRPVKGEVR